MKLLEFVNTERIYRLGSESWHLGPLHFSIDHREDVAIIGASGSGKSTLLHLAAGFIQMSKGDILFEGNSLSKMSEKNIQEYRNKKIGFVFQDFYLFPEFTLLENVEMPLRVARLPRKECKMRAEKALENVGLAKKWKHLPRELSGGERQRGAIARALVHNPKILFADEPTGNLDAKNGEKIIDLLRTIHKKGDISFVIVTHDEHIARLMSRVITLEDGKLMNDTLQKKSVKGAMSARKKPRS